MHIIQIMHTLLINYYILFIDYDKLIVSDLLQEFWFIVATISCQICEAHFSFKPNFITILTCGSSILGYTTLMKGCLVLQSAHIQVNFEQKPSISVYFILLLSSFISFLSDMNSLYNNALKQSHTLQKDLDSKH